MLGGLLHVYLLHNQPPQAMGDKQDWCPLLFIGLPATAEPIKEYSCCIIDVHYGRAKYDV